MKKNSSLITNYAASIMMAAVLLADRVVANWQRMVPVSKNLPPRRKAKPHPVHIELRRARDFHPEM